MPPLFRKRRREQPARDQRHAQGPPPHLHAEAPGQHSIAIATDGGFYGRPRLCCRPLRWRPYPGWTTFPGGAPLWVALPNSTVLSQPGAVVVQAVHGLGGIGKSALAAHWAVSRARAAGCAPIRWITADSAASVQRDLADLAGALQPASAEALPAADLTERAVQWLATTTVGCWCWTTSTIAGTSPLCSTGPTAAAS
ncbi:hypothetical protein [Streptomyces sp. NPDC088254]|uniref:hypothetical protein n=1 Tax=Streptomyces sp. NPDC088254 TaxID=3365847 RepID=UPI00382CB5A2